MVLREKRRQATIDEIVDVALRLVTDGGFEALTLQRLASELGCAAGAIYRYLPSKEAILVAVQGRVLAALGEDLSLARAKLEQTRLDQAGLALLRVLVFARTYAGLAHRRPAHFRLLTLSLADPRQLLSDTSAAEIAPAMHALLGEVTRNLAEATKAGALAPGDATARTLIVWGSLQGVLQLGKLGRSELLGLDLDLLPAATLEALLIGWGADATRVKQLDRRARELLPETVKKSTTAPAPRKERR